MPLGLADYLIGVALFSVPVAAAGWCATVIVGRQLGHLAGGERVLGLGLIFTAALIAVHLLPGTLGVLGRATVLATSAILASAVSSVPHARAPRPPLPTSPSNSSALSRVIAGVAVLALTLLLVVYLREWFGRPLTGVDALNFHIPDVARWTQERSIWGIHQFVPDLAHGNYPNNGNVLILAATLPWHDDFLVRVVFLPWFLLTGVAVYALARRLGAPSASSVLAACVALALPNTLYDLFAATLPDVVMTGTFAGGLVFLLRHAQTHATSDLVLAGLGLGLALGTKWFGFSSFIAVLVVWLAARLLARRGVAATARQAAVLVGVSGAAGGIWLLRNLVLSGNPVFPQKVSLAGATIFDAPRDTVRERVGFSLAHYATDTGVWREYFVPAFERSLGFTGYALAAAVVAALVLAMRHREEGATNMAAVAGVAAIVLTCVYVVTPLTAAGFEGRPVLTFVNVRYAVPGVLVAASVAAWLTGRAGRARPLLELLAVALAVDGARRAVGVDPRELAVAAVIVVVAASLAYALVRLIRTTRRGWAAVLAVATLTILAALGFRQQRQSTDPGYRAEDPAFAYVIERASSGQRIGLAGTWTTSGTSPVAPMFGPRLANRVVYVGPFIRGMLREYRTPGAFRRALSVGDYDLLLVGRGVPPVRLADEERWARAAGFRVVTSSERLALLRRR